MRGAWFLSGSLMIRILLADDHQPVRKGLRRILASDKQCTVCAEAANGEEALALCLEHNPDVVILDVRMPKLDGFAAAQKIRSIAPRAAIMIVTLHDGIEARKQATAAGALAFLCKSQAELHLLPAVHALAHHRPYIAA